MVNHVNGQQLNLGAGSQVNGNQILTDADPLSIDWSDISNRPAGLDNGDDNTQRSETEVENFITNGSIDLNVSTTIGGETILTTSTDSDTWPHWAVRRTGGQIQPSGTMGMCH